MSPETINTGRILGVGGSNARVATYDNGDILEFASAPTPQDTEGFFQWLAGQVLLAADKGSSWVVAGFPGPVSADGAWIGPMANVPGLASGRHNVADKLTAVDPAVGRLFAQKFRLLAVNDGELAAQAAASESDDPKQTTIAALIVGTGVGAGIVDLDPTHPGVFRPDRRSSEIGHIPLSEDPYDTHENAIAGPALTRIYDCSPDKLPKGHPAWGRVSSHVARLAMTLGLMSDVDRVTVCGGVGAGAADKYISDLQRILEGYRTYGSDVQKLYVPEVVAVSPDKAQEFEMWGAAGVVRDFMTRGNMQVA